LENKYVIKILNHNSLVALKGINDVPHYYEITIVLEGEFIYILDGKEYKVSAGDAIFVRQGQNRFRPPNKGNINYYSLNFYCNTEEIPQLPTMLKQCVTNEIKRVFRLMETTFKDHTNENRHNILYHYICILIMELQNAISKNSVNPYINEMINYISDNITKKIGLAEIANSVNLSVSYCCYLFKKEMNTTIYDVILKERIYLAQEYILAGEYSLKEVGKMCGFCDYSHFLKSFKKVTGILPSEFI